VPENNDNISIEEMMKNLKRGNEVKPSETLAPKAPHDPSEGTLVTRADGSKALKVRSRKRRSTQPKKEKEKKDTRNKIILICSGIFLVVMLGISFVVTLAYYNGNSFNEKVITTIKSKSGADVEMSGLSVSPGSAEVGQLKFDWVSTNSVVDYLNLIGLNADYGIFSFLGGGWNGAEVLADSGELMLYMKDSPDRISLSGETPVEFDFETYKCNRLNAIIGKEKNWLVANTQAQFSVNDNGAKQLYLYGGELKSPILDIHNIQSGVIEIKQTYADLSLSIQPKSSSGTVTLTGEVGYKKGSKVSLATKFDDIDMDGWVDIKTQRFINGIITKGEGFFKMDLGDEKSKEILTHVESNKIGISTFAFIETLSLEMKDSFYTRPSFTSGSKFSMNWLKDKVVFSDIKLIETSHMEINGDFEVDILGDIKGEMRIGIPIVSLSSLEVRRLKKIFKHDDGDLIWTDITIGGTLASPTDDLADQFARVKRKSPEATFDQLNEELSD